MRNKRSLSVVPLLLVMATLGIPAVVNSAEEQHPAHKEVTGMVVQKAGELVVKSPEGVIYQLHPKGVGRHGHESFKEGDKVTVVVDQNNVVMEVRPKGKEGKH